MCTLLCKGALWHWHIWFFLSASLVELGGSQLAYDIQNTNYRMLPFFSFWGPIWSNTGLAETGVWGELTGFLFTCVDNGWNNGISHNSHPFTSRASSVDDSSLCNSDVVKQPPPPTGIFPMRTAHLPPDLLRLCKLRSIPCFASRPRQQSWHLPQIGAKATRSWRRLAGR
jgi:hypothetical protein